MTRFRHLVFASALLGALTASVPAAPAHKTPDPLTAGEQRWSQAARHMVDELVHNQAAAVYQHELAEPRKKDTTQAAFTSLLSSVNQSLGPVIGVSRLPKLEDSPVGAVLGIPADSVVKQEEDRYKDRYYDTIWSLKTKGGGQNYLLMTLVAENHAPRILWLEFAGESIRTPEYKKVEGPMKAQAQAFLNKLLDGDKKDIMAHDLTTQFLRRLPGNHVESMLEDVRHHVGAVGGVRYVNGWVQDQPEGVTVLFRQKDYGPHETPYELMVRLAEEHGTYKVDALGDEWNKKPAGKKHK